MISIKILKTVGNIKVESYNVTKDGDVKVHFRNNFGTETVINVNTNYKKYKPS